MFDKQERNDQNNERDQEESSEKSEPQVRPEWMDTLEKGVEIGKPEETDTSNEAKD